MRRNDPFQLKTPLFFKIWFAMIATLAFSIIGITIYIMASAYLMGPEAVGNIIGVFLRGIRQGMGA